MQAMTIEPRITRKLDSIAVASTCFAGVGLIGGECESHLFSTSIISEMSRGDSSKVASAGIFCRFASLMV